MLFLSVNCQCCGMVPPHCVEKKEKNMRKIQVVFCFVASLFFTACGEGKFTKNVENDDTVSVAWRNLPGLNTLKLKPEECWAGPCLPPANLIAEPVWPLQSVSIPIVYQQPVGIVKVTNNGPGMGWVYQVTGVASTNHAGTVEYDLLASVPNGSPNDRSIIVQEGEKIPNFNKFNNFVEMSPGTYRYFAIVISWAATPIISSDSWQLSVTEINYFSSSTDNFQSAGLKIVLGKITNP